MLIKVFVNGDNKKVKSQLLKSGNEELAKYIEGNFWFSNCPNPLKMYNILKENNLLNEIESHIYDVQKEEFFKPIPATDNENAGSYEELSLKYDELLKFIFIQQQFNVESIDNVVKACRVFKNIEKYELTFNKSVLEFNEEEAGAILEENRFIWSAFYTMSACYLLYDYVNGFKDVTPWDEYRGEKRISEKISELNKGLFNSLNRSFLIEYVSESEKLQVDLMPLLIFEGVQFKRNARLDEMVNIRHDDIREDGIVLRSIDRGERFLYLAPEIMELVYKTMNQKNSNGVDLYDTGYLFKPSTRQAKTNSGALKYITLRKRLEEFSRGYTEKFNLSQNINVMDIESLGQIYYVKRFMVDGLKYKDAFLKAMERFDHDFTNGGTYDEKETKNSVKRKIFKFTNTWRKYGSEKDIEKFSIDYTRKSNPKKQNFTNKNK